MRRVMLPVIQLAMILIAGTGNLRAQLGWADLHNHPASHLAFGHQERGLFCSQSMGLFHGAPGLAWDPTDDCSLLLPALEACDPIDHNPCLNADTIQNLQRIQIVKGLENRLNIPHDSDGHPGFTAWPNALSRLHQQMHVQWLHRAYEGGMRFMVASVTDNELLDDYYHDNALCMGVFRPSAGHDFTSAIRQIQLLRDIEAANSSWMKIALTPADAAGAIANNKLAIVLGTEMDALTPGEILSLIDDFGVRSVIPIHLSDNPIGGTAAYDDLFNTLTGWEQGEYISVEGDARLPFRFGRPLHLAEEMAPFPLLGFCGIVPKPIELAAYQALGYEAVSLGSGHRNSRGITDADTLRSLMRKGVLLDVAHMSWKATQDTLDLAEQYSYPIIDSHTTLRDDLCTGSDCRGKSERDLTYAQAARIAGLGGMVGFGTEGMPAALRARLLQQYGEPAARFTGNASTWRAYPWNDDMSRAGHLVRRLRVRITTGEDELRGGGCRSTAVLRVNRKGIKPTLLHTLSGATGFADNSTIEVLWNLEASGEPGPFKLDDLSSFVLTLIQTKASGCPSPDNWDLAQLVIEYEGDDSGGQAAAGILVERSGVPYRRLTVGASSITMTATPAAPRRESERATRVKGFHFVLTTGQDDLNARLEAVIEMRDHAPIVADVRALPDFQGKFQKDKQVSFTLSLPDGLALKYGDIDSISLRETDGGGSLDWDNWDLQTIQVQLEACEPVGSDPCGSTRLETLVNHATGEYAGRPSYRLTATLPSAPLWTGLADIIPPDTEVAFFDLRSRTGGDDLGKSSLLSLNVLKDDGTTTTLLWSHDSFPNGYTQEHQYFRLIPPVAVKHIVSVGVSGSFGGGINADNWNLNGFDVSILSDPLARWADDVQRLYDAMAPSGVPRIGLGTDLNGLNPQMPFVKEESETPNLDELPPGFQVPRHQTTCGRVFKLQDDGIAHVGLLPDLLDGAIRAHPGGAVQGTMMVSAQAAIDVWTKAVAQAPLVP